MSIFYSDTEVRGSPPPIPYDKWNANKNFIQHYGNYLILSAMLKRPKDLREKLQVVKEIAICERKLDYWRKHINYDQNVVNKEVEFLKNIWSKHE